MSNNQRYKPQKIFGVSSGWMDFQFIIAIMLIPLITIGPRIFPELGVGYSTLLYLPLLHMIGIIVTHKNPQIFNKWMQTNTDDIKKQKDDGRRYLGVSSIWLDLELMFSMILYIFTNSFYVIPLLIVFHLIGINLIKKDPDIIHTIMYNMSIKSANHCEIDKFKYNILMILIIFSIYHYMPTRYCDPGTDLTRAAMAGETEEITKLLNEGAIIDENGKGSHNLTPLMWATHRNHTQAVDILIDEGANIEAKDKQGWTAFRWAVYRWWKDELNGEMSETLLTKGANINAKDNDNSTALATAAYYGHVDSLNMLLDRGADFENIDNHGKTALMWAEEREHPEIVKLLKESMGKKI